MKVKHLVCSSLLLVTMTSPSLAQVELGDKHLFIIRQGLDAAWGSYVFSVSNHGEEAAFQGDVMLPEETVDFAPQEGLMPDELELTDQGLQFNKKFPPGMHVLGVGFKIEASLGKATMTLTPPKDMENFTILLPGGTPIRLLGPTIERVGDHSFGMAYEPWRLKGGLKQGQKVEFHIEGLPQGRKRLWGMGAVVGGVLLLIGFLLGFKNRPKLQVQSETMV